MNAQLIYATEDQRAIAWMRERFAERDTITRAHQVFTDRARTELPIPDGAVRQVAYVDNVAIGLVRDPAEATPDGWQIHPALPVFIPEPATAAGAPWQLELDALPSTDWLNPQEIGIPHVIQVSIPNSIMWADQSELFLDRDGTHLYSLWHDRDVKPWLDPQFSANPMGWKEIPRSQWYALLEAAEDGSGRP